MILSDSNWQRFPVRGQEVLENVMGGSGDAAENVTRIRHRVRDRDAWH